MANTNMNIRMDSDIKKQAQKVFAELGLDMTTAINIFLRQSIRYKGLPFDVRLNIPNAETIAAIEESENLLNDPSAKRFSSVEELFKELNS